MSLCQSHVIFAQTHYYCILLYLSGFVNCGCKYTFKKGHEAEGSCNNTFPECPAIEDVNEDFGNAW